MALLKAQQKSFTLTKLRPSTLRKISLILTNPLYLKKNKFIYDRSSVVPSLFINHSVKIYSGNKFHTRLINRWMVGYKYGEFSWTRKLALYKAKQLKKKKK